MIFQSPQTHWLLSPDMSDSIVEVSHLTKTFISRRGRGEVFAVRDVSFEVREGQTLGIVGESGSGKSTVARCVTGLLDFEVGQISIMGKAISEIPAREMRKFRQNLQIVFQEPLESLDPRYRVRQLISEPLELHSGLDAKTRRDRVEELMDQVSLETGLSERYPHELSGGQQQRVNIARALATGPKVVVLDEPTASLDVSVQLEILELLIRLQAEFGLTYILISHNLSAIRAICDTVAVMYMGRIVESGPVDSIYSATEHPYTDTLLGAYLPVDPRVPAKKALARGEITGGLRTGGCDFAPRCEYRISECQETTPDLQVVNEHHLARCIRVGLWK